MYFLFLKNTGQQYENTVHNLGEIFYRYSMVFLKDHSTKYNLSFNRRSFNGKYEVYEICVDDQMVFYFLLLDGYINCSGENLHLYKKELPNFNIKNMIAVYDDITLNSECVLMSRNKGTGTHNGARGLDQFFSKNYWRMRIGYTRPLACSFDKFVLKAIDSQYYDFIQKFANNFWINFFKITAMNIKTEEKFLIKIQQYVNENY